MLFCWPGSLVSLILPWPAHVIVTKTCCFQSAPHCRRLCPTFCQVLCLKLQTPSLSVTFLFSHALSDSVTGKHPFKKTHLKFLRFSSQGWSYGSHWGVGTEILASGLSTQVKGLPTTYNFRSGESDVCGFCRHLHSCTHHMQHTHSCTHHTQHTQNQKLNNLLEKDCIIKAKWLEIC